MNSMMMVYFQKARASLEMDCYICWSATPVTVFLLMNMLTEIDMALGFWYLLLIRESLNMRSLLTAHSVIETDAKQ